MQILTCFIDYRKTVGGEAHRVCVFMCESERDVTSLCVCNELHVMYTAGELKQSWQKSHRPVRKCQPCNLVVSMYEVTMHRISCVLEHGNECVCLSECVYTCICLSVLYLCECSCVCVCAHACIWACWDRSNRHTCRLGEQLEAQREDGRITLRLLLHARIVLLEKCAREWERHAQFPTISLLSACVISSFCESSSLCWDWDFEICDIGPLPFWHIIFLFVTDTWGIDIYYWCFQVMLERSYLWVDRTRRPPH